MFYFKWMYRISWVELSNLSNNRNADVQRPARLNFDFPVPAFPKTTEFSPFERQWRPALKTCTHQTWLRQNRR
jgi:hypothetical protein